MFGLVQTNIDQQLHAKKLDPSNVMKDLLFLAFVPSTMSLCLDEDAIWVITSWLQTSVSVRSSMDEVLLMLSAWLNLSETLCSLMGEEIVWLNLVWLNLVWLNLVWLDFTQRLCTSKDETKDRLLSTWPNFSGFVPMSTNIRKHLHSCTYKRYIDSLRLFYCPFNKTAISSMEQL